VDYCGALDMVEGAELGQHGVRAGELGTAVRKIIGPFVTHGEVQA